MTFRFRTEPYNPECRYLVFKTKREAQDYLKSVGGGEMKQLRVIEPERKVGEGAWGERIKLWFHEDAGTVMTWDDLPMDEYMYHNTDPQNIESIKAEGLRSLLEENWRRQQYGEPLEEQTRSRLYLMPTEDDCLSYRHSEWDYDRRVEKSGQVSLRFRRALVEEKTLRFDGRYDGAILTTYVIDTVIPRSSLERCTRWARKRRGRGWDSTWTPL